MKCMPIFCCCIYFKISRDREKRAHTQNAIATWITFQRLHCFYFSVALTRHTARLTVASTRKMQSDNVCSRCVPAKIGAKFYSNCGQFGICARSTECVGASASTVKLNKFVWMGKMRASSARAKLQFFHCLTLRVVGSCRCSSENTACLYTNNHSHTRISVW